MGDTSDFGPDFDDNIMREIRRSESGGFNPRILLAFGLFLISGVLALSALKESPMAGVARPGSTPLATTWSVPLNSKLGHSYWNELVTSLSRGLPSFGQSTSSQRSFAIKAAGGRLSRRVAPNKTLTP